VKQFEGNGVDVAVVGGVLDKGEDWDEILPAEFGLIDEGMQLV
jgi:hypothetical protein